MSFLSVVPEIVSAAAGDLEGLGSALTAANAAAAPPTTAVAAPGADAVSSAIAAVFGTHGQQYQSLGAQLTAFHERFVSTLNAGISQYLGTEVANARQTVASRVSTHPLFERAVSGFAAAEASFASAMGCPDFNFGLGAKASVAASGGASSTPVTTLVAGAVTGPITGSPVTAPPAGSGPVATAPPPSNATVTPVTLPVLNQSTPLGPVQLTLNGTTDGSTFTLQSGSLVLPSQITLAIDALGAPYNAMTSLGNSSAAFNTALRSGNLSGAVTALTDAPGNAMHSFLYGQQTLTLSQAAPDGSGISQLGVSIPMDGWLVNGPDQAIAAITPTGGSPAAVPLTGVQFSGLGAALPPGGALPTPMQALAGHVLPALGVGSDGSFTATVFDQQTPFGEVSLSLSGTVDTVTGAVTLTGASAVVPPSAILAVDALGAPYNAYVALGSGGPALVNAVQTGNYGAAVGILAHAPGDVWHEFLYGQQTLTVSQAAPAGSGFSQLGVNVPMDGLLVHGPDSVTVSATPTGGGAPQVVALTGAEVSGLGAALQHIGGLPTPMQAVAAQAVGALPGFTTNPDGSFTGTVFDQQTPWGEVSLTLSGMVDPVTGMPTLTGASAVVPPQALLAVDALGAPYNAYVALGPGGPALLNAVQTGNYGAAVGILAHAPGDVWHDFLYGQQTLTVSEPGDGQAYSQLGASVPMNGLLVNAPGSATISATPVGGGAAQVVTVSGAQINGLVPALHQLGGQLGAGMPVAMKAVAAQAVSALPGLTFNVDGSGNGTFGGTVFDQQTPCGEVSLSLSGTVAAGMPTLTGASAVVPPQALLAVDALGAPYNAYVALGPGGPALLNAVQTGNYGAAVGILAHAPGDVWHDFLYGQQTLTVSEPGDGQAYSQLGASVPMNGLLVNAPGSATISATPVGGGAAQVVTVSGAQINGLVPALHQLGGQLGAGMPVAMKAVAAQAVSALPGLTFNVDGSGNGTFGGTVFDQQTPCGEVSLSLSGTVAAGMPTLTGASAVVPPQALLAVDALGAPYNAYVALGPGGPALLNAVQTGNYGAAVGILAHAPGDVWHDFLYGQQTLTVSEPGDGQAYSQLGASVPMNGLLVNAPGSATISATPVGGGAAQVVTVSGAQINGLVPALHQLGGQLGAGMPVAMKAVAAQAVSALPGLTFNVDGSGNGTFGGTVFDQQTPFGEVSLSLSGTVAAGMPTLTGASAVVPPQALLAVDALGAPYNAYVALGPGGPALLNAVQTGNYGAAVGILAHAPGDVWHDFLYGQQTLTVSEPGDGQAYSQLGASVPMNGLLVNAPGSATISATPVGGGAAQVVTVSGAQINGLVPALHQLGGQLGAGMPVAMKAVAAQAVSALPGLTFNVDGSGNGTFGGTVFDQQTPWGEVSLSLSGTVAAGMPTLTGASAVVPPQALLAVDALGAPYNAYVALGPGGPALLNAVQTGNYGAAVGILAHAPGDVWHDFLYGQQTLTVSEPGDGQAYSQLGASVPMNGLLVNAPGSATISATPVGGGAAQVVTVSGAQINGLVPALHQLGGQLGAGMPVAMKAVAAQAVSALPGLTFNVDGSGNGTFGGTVFDQQTPWGEVSLSLSGTVAAGMPTLTGASAVVPPQALLAVDALGAPYNAYVALGPGGPALLNAVQTGNYGAAVGILAHAPGDVWHDFLYGQQTLTVSEPGDGQAYSQLGASVPMNGLLVNAPGSATISATPVGGGAAQVVTVSGAQINGLVPALHQLGGQLGAGMPVAMKAVAAQAVSALPGLTFNVDGSGNGTFGGTVFDQQTPCGEVSLSLSGTVAAGMPTLTGASAVVPPQALLAVDALGAPYNAYVALGPGGPALLNAVQTGNYGAAVGILAHAPGDVWHDFLYGQQTLTVSEPGDGQAYSQLGASAPMNGLLVNAPGSITLSATPTGGGAAQVVTVSGAQFNGLVPALHQLGGQLGAGMPVAMQALAGHAMPALLGVGDYTQTVFDQQTPFGEVQLSLNVHVPLVGDVQLTGGSLVLPQPLTWVADGLGAPYDAYVALGSAGPAFVGALQSGNVGAALGILANSPGDVWQSFLYGQQTLTLSQPAPGGYGFSQVGVGVPMDGLLVHGASPATVSATSTDGSTSGGPLTGAQFGGLIPALQDAGILP